jgi:hypothetical protein
VRPLGFVLVTLLGCSRGSGLPSPSPTPGADGDAAPIAQPSSSAWAQACVPARIALETMLVKLPTACKTAGDCDGYYLRTSACEPPVVLAKPGTPPDLEAPLERLQAEVRRSCPADSNACSPRPFRADCRNGRCVDALGHPSPR